MDIKLSLENKLMIFFGSGLLMLISCGYLGWIGFPTVINGKITEYKKLDNHESFEFWKKLPVAMDFKVYFFNVTNPDDIVNGSLPNLNEIGPFVYEEYISKDLLNSSNPMTFRFMKRSVFKFSEEKSNGLKESDLITVINLPLMGIALFLERNLPFGLDMLEESIPHIFPTKNPLFITDTVSNLLFNGIRLSCTAETAMFCMAVKTKPLQTLKFNKTSGDFSFAFFRHKNDTSGPFEADKGLEDVRSVGQIVSYKDENVLNVWVPNSTCDEIRGTDSTMFGPFIPKDQPLYAFESDICISGSVEYIGETEYLGLPVSKFVGSKSNFEEDETNCKCPREDYSDPSSQLECLGPGLVDLTPCQGAPVIASQPHFYQANDFLQFTNTLQPVPEKHETYTLIETITGSPVKAKKRLQLNIQLKHIEDISLLKNVMKLIFPVLWIEEGIELDAEIIRPLFDLYTVLGVLNVGKWVLLGVSLFLIAVGLIYYTYKKNMQNSNNSDLPDNLQHPERVLFSKVTRKDDFNSYSPNSVLNNSQMSPSTFIRERLYNNMNNIDGNYVMKLNDSLYPSTLNARNLARSS